MFQEIERQKQPEKNKEQFEQFSGNQAAATRAMEATALNHGLDALLRIADYVSSGAEVHPAQVIAYAQKTLDAMPVKPPILSQVESILGDSDAMKFLESCDSIRKDGNKITIQRKGDTEFTCKIGMNHASVDGLHIDKTMSFNLRRDADKTEHLSNLKGISMDATVHGIGSEHRRIPVEDITVTNTDGSHPVFHARLKNPKNIWERIVTMDSSHDILVGVKVSDTGQISAQTEKSVPANTAVRKTEPTHLDFSTPIFA